MTAKEVRISAIIILVCIFLIGFSVGRFSAPKCADTIGTTTVTTVTRDTIAKPVPPPAKSTIVRTETVKPILRPAKARSFMDGITSNPQVENENAPITIDSAGVVSIPITERVYKTDDYTATVEGYNPILKSIVLYPKIVTNTTTVTKYKPPRWAVTVGPGCSYDGKVFTPGVTATVGFVLWSK